MERKIKSLGWKYLCTIDLPIYPNLVREFYRNSKVGVSTIESKVRGIKILLIAAYLDRILKVSIDGTDRLEDQ